MTNFESASPGDSEYLPIGPRRWPTVLGILALLWGSLGLVRDIMWVCGVGQAQQPAVMRGPIGTSLSLLGALLTLALLAAGIQLLRRRASGVQLLKAWVIFTILIQGSLVAIMVQHRDDFEQAMRDQLEQKAEADQKSGAKQPALPAGVEKIVWFSTVACTGAAIVIPAAIVAFFVFGRRGREAMIEWTQPPATM